MKKILIVATLALLMGSCGREKFAEINTNPGAVTKPDPSYLFLNAQNDMRANEYIIFFYTANRAALPWSQINVGDRGSLNNTSMFDISRWDNPFWGALYGTGGKIKELQNVINNMPEEDKAINQNLYHMSQIMFVQFGIYASDFNGDIPYTDALQGLYTNPPVLKPKYDTQESIYDTMDAELKAAIEVLDNDALMATQVVIKKDQEPVYRSDYKKWVKYANALRLKIALRLIHANPVKAKQIAQEVANSSYMTSNEDDYRFVADKWNFGPGGPGEIWSGQPSVSFINLLKANRDPRIRFAYDKNPYNPGVVQGMLDQGIVFPDYLANEMVVTDGKFIRWKSAEMGDGDQYLGEPWVRYQGIPLMISSDLPQGEDAKYILEDKFQVKIDDTKRSFMPYSYVNRVITGPNVNQYYPSMNKVQDEYKPNSTYNYTIVLVSAAETNFTLALFASQGGVTVPGKTANELYQNGIRLSVNAYNKSAEHMNILYYNDVYDRTTFVNAEGKEEVIEKPVKLLDDEIDNMFNYPLGALTGDARQDVEKCFIQLTINCLLYPADIFTYSRLGGTPMRGSTVWPRELFVKDAAVDKTLNIPRHLKFDAPDPLGLNYDNQKEAFERQGFLDYSSASPDMGERMWNDKNSPAWGEGPILH